MKERMRILIFQLYSSRSRYQPSTGYQWMFEEDEEDDPVALLKLYKKRKRRKILDVRRPGERTEAEEEGIRSSEAIDRILVRLSKSSLVSGARATKKSADDKSDTTSVKAPSVASEKE